MVETVTAEQFTTGPARRKPESFEFVKFRIDAGVARLTLNRPDHNLLNEAMLREIADGIVFAGEHDEVKLIVIDSACKVFSGGIDIASTLPNAFIRCWTPSKPPSPECWKSASPSSAS